MKVKVSYTVDLEDVLSEVNGLYEKADKILDHVKSYSSLLVSNDNIDEYLTSVDNIRRKMYDYDLLMADIDGIVRSYAETKYGLKEKEKEVLNG